MKSTILSSPFLQKALLAIALASGQFYAQAQDLLITPRRVVFEGPKRIQELNLVNISPDSARYGISFIQIRMKSDGSFEQISQPDSGQYFADKYLRVFPRTVTLAPNEAQVVKLQVTGTSKLTEGEYRSHLYFRSIAKPVPLGEKPKEVTDGVAVTLTPIYGISIPAIIRKGETSATVRISGMKLEQVNEAPAVGFRIHRTGDRSVYGHLRVEYISSDGQVTEVSTIKGVSVYTPNAYRDVTLKLNNSPGVSYRTGRLRVTYTDAESKEEGELASAEISLR